jgi:hypothetical protein
LTGRVFDHPVVTKQGRRYALSLLLSLLSNGCDPMTGDYLSSASIITDRALLARIQTWKQLTGWAAERRHGEQPTIGDLENCDKEYNGGKKERAVEDGDNQLTAFDSTNTNPTLCVSHPQHTSCNLCCRKQ